MHPIDLIAFRLDRATFRPEPLPEEPRSGICAITGSEGPTIRRKHLLGASFTEGALLRAPDSDRVSVAAWEVFTAAEDRGKARGFRPERMSSWLCDGLTFRPLDRAGVRAAVLDSREPVPPWCGYATTSYKKHGSLRAPVNGPGRRLWLWEMRVVDCSDRDDLIEIWLRLNRALRQGFGRSVLETVECPPWLMAKVGLAAWLEFEAWARPRRNSALYAFLCYLLPSQEELKNGEETHPETRAEPEPQ
jgi:hypothetical protein